jgi:hypothetical protein
MLSSAASQVLDDILWSEEGNASLIIFLLSLTLQPDSRLIYDW